MKLNTIGDFQTNTNEFLSQVEINYNLSNRHHKS